jgi:hypothetical protein
MDGANGLWERLHLASSSTLSITRLPPFGIDATIGQSTSFLLELSESSYSISEASGSAATRFD